nr:transcriptional regulator FilR1 domain-containing protein [Methanolobus chelungpuianus]
MNDSIGLERILSNNKVDLFVHPGSFRFLSFGYNDNNAILSPLNDSGDFDNRHMLCTDSHALQWVKDLYEHYVKDAVAVTLMDVRPTLQADVN